MVLLAEGNTEAARKQLDDAYQAESVALGEQHPETTATKAVLATIPP
ncbi:MAG: hypothetical protein ABI467_13090 [Kofleriaceae bacterium]